MWVNVLPRVMSSTFLAFCLHLRDIHRTAGGDQIKNEDLPDLSNRAAAAAAVTVEDLTSGCQHIACRIRSTNQLSPCKIKAWLQLALDFV